MQTLQKLAHSHQEIELMHERLTWDYCCDPANMYKLQNIFIFAKHICIGAIVQYRQYAISLGLLSCEDWGKLLLMPNATRLIVFRDRSNVIRVMVFLHTIHGVWSSANTCGPNNESYKSAHCCLHQCRLYTYIIMSFSFVKQVSSPRPPHNGVGVGISGGKSIKESFCPSQSEDTH